MRFSSSGSRVKCEEISVHILVYFHYSSFISTSVAVVWGREDCDNMLVVRPIVASHYKLMRSRNQL
jgi:hypothetical protein